MTLTKYLGKVENDQMKKRRLGVNERFNVKLEKFKQLFHQPVEEKEVQTFVQTAIGRTHFHSTPKSFEMQLLHSQVFL